MELGQSSAALGNFLLCATKGPRLGAGACAHVVDESEQHDSKPPVRITCKATVRRDVRGFKATVASPEPCSRKVRTVNVADAVSMYQ